MNQKILENLECYIIGQKGLASHYEIHERTLRRWNKRLPIPWEKSGNYKSARVRIHFLVAEYYLKALRKV